MSRSWIEKAQESDSWYHLPYDREYTADYGFWSGLDRADRIVASPLYLLAMLVLWFRGCFLGQDYSFLKTHEVDNQ